MADLTLEQQRKVDRYTEQGISEEKAVEIATETQLDVPLGKDGKSTLMTPNEFLASVELNR